jgi:hypothetical protein
MDPRAALGLVLGRHEGGSTDNLAILAKKLASLHSSNSQPPLVRMRWYSFSTPRRPSARLRRSVPRPASGVAPGALDRPTVVRYASFRNRSRISSYKRFEANSRAINTSETKKFNSPEMNTCTKICVGCRRGCLRVFSLAQAPQTSVVITSEQVPAQPPRRGRVRARRAVCVPEVSAGDLLFREHLRKIWVGCRSQGRL